MSIWAHCTGVIQLTHYTNEEEINIGNTFTFRDMVDNDDFEIPTNSIPYGSEGSLHVFKNILVLNKDFNETHLFTISGSLRDVNSIDSITSWLEKIIEKYSDSLDNILFEVTVSPFLSEESKTYIYSMGENCKLIIEEK